MREKGPAFIMAKGPWTTGKELTCKWNTPCVHCHRTITPLEKFIFVKKHESYHFDCFEGSYRPENSSEVLPKVRRGVISSGETQTEQILEVSERLPETWDHQEIKVPVWTSDISDVFDSKIPETPAQTVTPTDATMVVNGFISLMAQPFEARLSKVEADTRESLKTALKAISEQTGKLDEDKVLELIEKNAVKRVIVTSNDETRPEIDLGVQHEQFELLLKSVSMRLPDGTRPNVWLSGPAGSGKTKAAENVAKAMGVKFYFTGALAEPYSLLGFKSASGEYQRTAFREAYEHGGLFLWDEVDASEPVALMPFNAALANGHCAFPDTVVPRHKDCIIMASANTWGHGAKDSYVGRMKLDGAFLDRFKPQIPWRVDENLERAIAGNDEWVRRVQSVRRKVAEKGIKVLITPRASIVGATMLAAGFEQSEVETLVLRAGMTDEQWQGVR